MKIINFILVFLVLIGFSVGLVRAAELNTVIYFDPEINSKSFVQGEPITLFLVVSNPQAMNAHYYNIVAGKEKKKMPAPVSVGTSSVPWINLIKFTITDSAGKVVALKLSAHPVKKNKVNLDAENVAENYFFITPEDSQQLKADRYTLKAVLNNVPSNALTLTVTDKAKELNKQKQIDNLLKFGRYYLLLANFKQAEEYAYKILAIDKRSLRGLILLGDAQTGLGKYEEAYQTFNRAIKEFSRQYPAPRRGSLNTNYRPPDLLTEKIHNLERKLKR